MGLPAGEAGVFAESVRLAMNCVSGRRILGAYLLSEEQRSLLECQASDAAASARDGEAFAFAWNVGLVRALGLHATWRPLLQAPIHPLEVSSKLSLPAQTEGHDDALRALTAASRQSGHTAVLLRVGAAVSAVKQAAAAAAARAAQFDAAAVSVDAAAGRMARLAGNCSTSMHLATATPGPTNVSDSPARLKVVDFLDRSIASLTRNDGFSHLSALAPRGEAETIVTPVPRASSPPAMHSKELSMARIHAEAFLNAAAAANTPVGMNGQGSSPAGAGRCGAFPPQGCEALTCGGRPGGAVFDATVVRPCVLHATQASQAAVAHARLASAAAQRRARVEHFPSQGQPSGDEGTPEGEGGWRVVEPCAWPGALSRALPSRHDLPENGNWVRLSAAQQVPTSLPARAVTQPSTHSTFGSEPRLSSASRRWSYQTSLPFTKRGPVAAGIVAGKPVPGTAPAGSFLPLRLAAAGDACHHGAQVSAQGAAAVSRGHRRSDALDAAQVSPQQAQAAHDLLGALCGLVGGGGMAPAFPQPSEGPVAAPLLRLSFSAKEAELWRKPAALA